jgi:isopenicillin N synthase-like dioxygenase
MLSHPEQRPDFVDKNIELFERFNTDCHSTAVELLICLSDLLGLKDNSRFEENHQIDDSSLCTLNLFRYPRQIVGDTHFGHNKHTDNGTFTLLLTEQPGLEVFSLKKTWDAVMPKPSCAVVNVGDTLRFLSGHKFRSAIHRVVPQFEHGDRYTVGYFLRAEDDTVIRDGDGVISTAKEYHDRKYVNYQASHAVQRTNNILLGGMAKELD